MKIKHIIVALICIGMLSTVDAQIFKKKNKETDSVATTKEKKGFLGKLLTKKNKNETDSVATSKEKKGVLGNLFSKKEKKPMGKLVPAPPDNNVKLPDSYHFSYHAKIKVINKEGTTETDYFLQPNASYFAKKSSNNDFSEHIVYDNERNMEVYFAEIKGEKRKARKKMGIFTKAKLIGAYKDAPDRTVKSIGTKTLLGYECQGFEISTDAGVTNLWVTNEAPATLYSALFASRADAPESPFSKNTMILETTFTSSKDPNKSYQMACVALEPNTLVFDNNDYKE